MIGRTRRCGGVISLVQSSRTVVVVRIYNLWSVILPYMNTNQLANQLTLLVIILSNHDAMYCIRQLIVLYGWEAICYLL
jgi:hypothetical protein